MSYYTPPVQNLIDQFSRLPGIGPKSAQRIAFFLLQASNENASTLAMAITTAKEQVRFCEICCNFSSTEVCELCQDTRRDASVICVVEESRDIAIVERSGEFSGRYHVLHGVMNPIEGIGPDQLRVKELLRRLNPSPSPSQNPSSSAPNPSAPSPSTPNPTAPATGAPPATAPTPTPPPATVTEIPATEIPATEVPATEVPVTEIIVATSPNIEGEATAMYLARLLDPLGVKVTRPASGLPVGGDLEYIDELTLGRALSARQQITP